MIPFKACGNHSNAIEFSWHMTNWCNYKCSYCPVLGVITNDFTKDEHTNHKIVLARLTTVQSPFNICISGGEPCLNPNLPEILERLTQMENCEDIYLMTNLSRSVDYYEKINKIGHQYKDNFFNRSKIVIMSSYHPEYYNDKFANKALELSKKIDRFQVSVNFSDNKDHWDTTLADLKMLLANDVDIKPTLLSQNINYTPNYTEEFYKVFEEFFANNFRSREVDCVMEDDSVQKIKMYEIEKNNWNRFKGWNCTPLYYTIDIEGNIRNICTSRVIGLSLANKNIVRQERCPNDVCPGRKLLDFYKERA